MARPDDQDELLVYIAAGAAILFTAAVVFIVVVQTIAPLFGAEAGAPSDAAIGTMIAAVVTLTTAAGVKIIRRVLSSEDQDREPPDEGVER